jgi:hypothetical protein
MIGLNGVRERENEKERVECLGLEEIRSENGVVWGFKKGDFWN